MKIAIVGYGIEGQSAAAYLRKHGHHITVCDRVEQKAEKTFPMRCGPHYLNNLEEFDLIFRSPGIPYLKKEFQPIRHKLTSVTKYFFSHCPCPIVGVTGTKGKGTTAALLYEMLKKGKRKVFLGGNIGNSPLDFLDKLKPADLVILELSSFQLQDLDRSPHIAVVLGITEDHLDHHATFEEYLSAKKNIVRFQKKGDIAILDVDNEASASFARETKGKIFSFSLKNTVSQGAFLKVGSFVMKQEKTGVLFGEKGETNLFGDHNIKNIFAAAITAWCTDVPIETITKVIREFKGLPHRLELVREFRGVKYYNDSASTNPDTAIAALKAFTEPLILIAGGSDKHVAFDPLGREIAERLNVKTVILMGETKQKLERAIEQACAEKEAEISRRAAKIGRPLRRRDIPLELITADTYQEAFMVAHLVAQPGDTVLLSPACASFDMFENFKQRGDAFRNFVMDFVQEENFKAT